MSKEEKIMILNQYTGWGGLRDVIYSPSVYKELKKYLSDVKIASIKQSTNSAYYTPLYTPLIKNAKGRALSNSGFS